jgi:hypothetical protein
MAYQKTDIFRYGTGEPAGAFAETNNPQTRMARLPKKAKPVKTGGAKSRI